MGQRKLRRLVCTVEGGWEGVGRGLGSELGEIPRRGGEEKIGWEITSSG